MLGSWVTCEPGAGSSNGGTWAEQPWGLLISGLWAVPRSLALDLVGSGRRVLILLLPTPRSPGELLALLWEAAWHLASCCKKLWHGLPAAAVGRFWLPRGSPRASQSATDWPRCRDSSQPLLATLSPQNQRVFLVTAHPPSLRESCAVRGCSCVLGGLQGPACVDSHGLDVAGAALETQQVCWRSRSLKAGQTSDLALD